MAPSSSSRSLSRGRFGSRSSAIAPPLKDPAGRFHPAQEPHLALGGPLHQPLGGTHRLAEGLEEGGALGNEGLGVHTQADQEPGGVLRDEPLLGGVHAAPQGLHQVQVIGPGERDGPRLPGGGVKRHQRAMGPPVALGRSRPIPAPGPARPRSSRGVAAHPDSGAPTSGH